MSLAECEINGKRNRSGVLNMYNGWTNWETWNSYNWLTNTENIYNTVRNMDAIKLEYYVTENSKNGVFSSDKININKINYVELSKGLKE